MTQISRDDVVHLAKLSKLQLTDDETDGLQVDIARILGYIEQLNELNTDGVEPTYQVTGLENVWRNDKAVEADVTREQLLALGPDAAHNQIKVPKIL